MLFKHVLGNNCQHWLITSILVTATLCSNFIASASGQSKAATMRVQQQNNDARFQSDYVTQ